METGQKIFISYKYHDRNVFQNVNHKLFEGRVEGERTPRDYVDVLETYIEDHSTHYYRAEKDNNDLSKLNDDQIWEILKDKIFDSTLTIVIISPGMKENKPDKDQWIPWEIEYSLGLQERKNSKGQIVRSYTNAMMAIVLPDRNSSYEYYFENKRCCSGGCCLNKTNSLFYILRKNTFNLKNNTNKRICNKKDVIYSGSLHSFIPFYKWEEVNNKKGIENAIQHAFNIRKNIDNYDICHKISD